MVKCRKNTIVLLTWDDIRTDLSTNEEPKPITSYSVGMVDESNRHYIRLKSSWYEDKDFPEKDTIVIPRGCVREVREL